MLYYVEASLHGRTKFCEFASWCAERNIIDAEYHQGGWVDHVVESVEPHIKFTNMEDAIAYALTIGASVSLKVPIKSSTSNAKG